MALQYMTQEGLDKLKKELAEAIAQRPVISAAIAEARDKGDLSENAEYEAAREDEDLEFATLTAAPAPSKKNHRDEILRRRLIAIPK